MTNFETRGFWFLLGVLLMLWLLKPSERRTEAASKDFQESADDLGMRIKKSGERVVKAERDRDALRIAADQARQEEAS